MIVPGAMAVLLRAAPPERKGAMTGVLGIPVLVDPMRGPVLGGVLTDALSWRWIFFVDVPVGVLVLLLGARGTRDDDERSRRPLDPAGLLTLSPGLAALLYGLTPGGDAAGTHAEAIGRHGARRVAVSAPGTSARPTGAHGSRK